MLFPLAKDHGWPVAVLAAGTASLVVGVQLLTQAAPVEKPMAPHAHSGGEVGAWLLGAAGVVLWQLFSLVTAPVPDDDHWRDLRGHCWKLALGGAVSAAALLLEGGGLEPTAQLLCRLAHGVAGAWVLIYAYLLLLAAFAGAQQVFALCCLTISSATCVVLGPLLGAWALHDGARGWHLCLGAAALATDVLLVALYVVLPTDPADEIVLPGERTPLISAATPSASYRSPLPVHVQDSCPVPPAGWPRLELVARLARHPAAAALLVLGPAAMLQAALEAALPALAPQGADLEALYLLFVSCFALGVVVFGASWSVLGRRGRAHATALCAASSALVSCGLLYAFGLPSDLSPYVQQWLAALNGSSRVLFHALLAHAGLCLGAVHASCALYLGELLGSLDGWGGAASKQVCVGVFALCGRLGSALGVACMGHPAWREEQQALTTLGSLVLAATLGFAVLAQTREAFPALLK